MLNGSPRFGVSSPRLEPLDDAFLPDLAHATHTVQRSTSTRSELQ